MKWRCESFSGDIYKIQCVRYIIICMVQYSFILQLVSEIKVTEKCLIYFTVILTCKLLFVTIYSFGLPYALTPPPNRSRQHFLTLFNVPTELRGTAVPLWALDIEHHSV